MVCYSDYRMVCCRMICYSNYRMVCCRMVCYSNNRIVSGCPAKAALAALRLRQGCLKKNNLLSEAIILYKYM